jgi:hypothetical protein
LVADTAGTKLIDISDFSVSYPQNYRTLLPFANISYINIKVHKARNLNLNFKGKKPLDGCYKHRILWKDKARQDLTDSKTLEPFVTHYSALLSPSIQDYLMELCIRMDSNFKGHVRGPATGFNDDNTHMFCWGFTKVYDPSHYPRVSENPMHPKCKVKGPHIDNYWNEVLWVAELMWRLYSSLNPEKARKRLIEHQELAEKGCQIR